MMTFRQLRAQAVQSAFPMGMPSRLDDTYGDDGTTVTQFGPFSNQLTACLIDIQQQSPFYKANHQDIWPFCSTYFQCGATVVQAPRAEQIHRVWTIPRSGACCPVFYYYVPSFDDWQQRLRAASPKWDAPDNTGLPTLQEGFLYNPQVGAADTTDKGIRWGHGWWTLHNGRMYIAPRIESWEQIVASWKGVRFAWGIDDQIPLNGPFADDVADRATDLVNVVTSWFKRYYYQHVRPDIGAWQLADKEWRTQRAMLLQRRDMEMQAGPQSMIYYPQPHSFKKTSDWPRHCKPDDGTNPTISYAIVGNVLAGDNALAVGDMVDSWKPDYLLTPGNAWGTTSVNTQAGLDANFGTYYHKFLFPYLGTAASQTAETQRAFPALGPLDRDPSTRFPVFRQYFNLTQTVPTQNAPSRGYYEKVLGPVHFFFLDAGYLPNGTTVAQTDGNTFASPQGAYFKQRIDASTARWKVVVIGAPPYSSATGLPTAGGFAAVRWPFDQLGVTAVISAGFASNYERLLVNGVNYMQVGTGGMALTDFGTVLDTSVIRSETFGALKLDATCASLTFNYFDSGGTNQDTLTISA